MSLEALAQSIRWSPSLSAGLDQGLDATHANADDTRVLPLFPLGVAYIPGTEQVTSRFETQQSA